MILRIMGRLSLINTIEMLTVDDDFSDCLSLSDRVPGSACVTTGVGNRNSTELLQTKRSSWYKHIEAEQIYLKLAVVDNDSGRKSSSDLHPIDRNGLVAGGLAPDVHRVARSDNLALRLQSNPWRSCPA